MLREHTHMLGAAYPYAQTAYPYARTAYPYALGAYPCAIGAQRRLAARTQEALDAEKIGCDLWRKRSAGSDGCGDDDDDDDDDDNDDDDDDGYDDNYFTVQKHASGTNNMSKSMSA